MNKLDWFFLIVACGLICFVAGAYISNDYALGALFALAGALLLLALLKTIPAKSKVPSYSLFLRHLLLEGKAQSNRYLYLLFAPEDMPEGDCYKAQGDRLVVNAISYGKYGEEGAAKLYRETKRTPPAHLLVAAYEIDRKAAEILGLICDDVKIWKPNKLYRHLKKAGLLEDIPKKKRAAKRVWVNVFRPKHAWLFLLNAVCILAMSFWLPFKAYYYVFAAVNALLAMGVVLYNRFA